MTDNYSRGFKDALLLMMAISVLVFLITLCYQMVHYEPARPRPTPEQQMEDTLKGVDIPPHSLFRMGTEEAFAQPVMTLYRMHGGDLRAEYQGKAIACKDSGDKAWTVLDPVGLKKAIEFIKSQRERRRKEQEDSL